MSTTKIIIALSLAIALLIAGIAFSIGKSSLTKKELNAIIQAGDNSIKAKDAQIAAQVIVNAQLAEDMKRVLADVALLRKDLISIKTDNDKLRYQLETAPPEGLVLAAQKFLDSKEIRLNGIKVEFGLVPFRTTVVRLSDWEDFTLRQIPKYEEAMVGYEKTAERMGAENGGLKTENLLLRERIASTDQIVKDIKSFIIARDRVTLWSWLRDTGLKFGIGYGVGRLMTK